MWDPIRTLHTQETKALAVPVEGRDGKSAWPLDVPMRTQTTRLETGLAHTTPFVSELYGTAIGRPVTEPAATFTASGNHHGLVTTAGGSWNDDARSTDEALRTVELTRHTGIVVGGFRSTLGRHSEIPEQTARAFWKQFEGVLGEGWWRR